MSEPTTDASPAVSADKAVSEAAPSTSAEPTASGEPAVSSEPSAEAGAGGAATGEHDDEAPARKRRRRRRRRGKKPEGEGQPGEGAEASSDEGVDKADAAGEDGEAGPQSGPQSGVEAPTAAGSSPGDESRAAGEGPRESRRGRRRGPGDREGGGDRERRGDGERRGDRERRDGDRREGRPRRDDRATREGRGRGDARGREGRDGRGGGGDRRERSGERGAGTLKASLFSHLAQSDLFSDVVDQQVQCRKAGCEKTWSWSRDEQLAQRLRLGHTRPPARLCAEHFAEERTLKDAEVECRVRGCGRTWTWSRDAQLKHRSWLDRQKARVETHGGGGEVGADASGDAEDRTEGEVSGKGARRRGKRRRRKLPDGPPARMCSVCEERISTLEAIEQPCKVHGCDKTWTWTREQQLEAWAALGTDDLTAIPKPPRRMCESCRDFCRSHQDREMACGKPGCGYSWTYKVGAQLQDHLAHRTLEPIRLACTVDRKIECEFSRHEKAKAESVRLRLPPGAELMPCVVPGCEQRWVFVPGMALASTSEGELSVDRMCDTHRAERDLPSRNTEYFEPEAQPELAAPDEARSSEEGIDEAAESSSTASQAEPDAELGVAGKAPVEEAESEDALVAEPEPAPSEEPAATDDPASDPEPT